MGLPKLSVLVLLIFSFCEIPTFAIKKPYVVYLGSHAQGPRVSKTHIVAVTGSHHEFLGSFLGSKEKARDAIIYSYEHHINGFAALLEDEDAAEIAKHPDVVSVFRNQGKKLHTTHSWGFMNLEKNGVVHSSSLWKKARFGEDTIIANLDTGVWPESKSFIDDNFRPVPLKWRGSCENDTRNGVPCNRKLIGAKYFNKGYAAESNMTLNSSLNSARDHDGHGSHTLSTAGGNFVPRASVYGVGYGTAKGGSPKSRVAAYKVCWPPINGSECFDADIMKAFDAATHDGVDVISVSLGGNPGDYFEDGIAIGAFHAVKEGVTVVCSAGNSGPIHGSVSNVAPWIITVAASTLDREFQAFAQLRNGLSLKGGSMSSPMAGDGFHPLIAGPQARAANASAVDALLCKPGTLDPAKAKGKILVCLRGDTARVDKGREAALAGAVGMILCNDKSTGNQIIADPHFLPATHLNYADGLSVFAYLNSTKHPMGYITPPTARLNTKPAPYMAAFSSRGPNTVTPQILKPDITAPGVNIIAAFTQDVSATGLDFDKRKTPFYTESGTSMSCPHVSGVVGLLKTLYPNWSPAAIRSAIMTTSITIDNTLLPMLDEATFDDATPLDYGAGHVRPDKAMNPGLVYDLTTNDYLDFLCASGYNQTQLKAFAGGPYKCPESVSLLDFNYPSISVPKLAKGEVTLTRKVKNVGQRGVYKARTNEPYGVSVSVEPKVLSFENVGEEKSFKVTLKARVDGVDKDYRFGGLLWSDGVHFVRTPIVVGSAN